MKCIKCKTELSKGDKFCKQCGTKCYSKSAYIISTIALLVAICLLIQVKDMEPAKKTVKFEYLTEDKNEKLINALKECGIQEIKNITHDEILDDEEIKGYRVSTEYDQYDDVIVYANNDDLQEIRFLGNELYKNEEFISLATDHFLTSSQQSKYYVECKKLVKSTLKSPSTAKFPKINDWVIAVEDGKVIVQSYVDAENSFGATLRSNFQVIIEDDNITSFIFDGKECI